MQANLSVIEQLQATAGTTGCDHPILNSGTLPVLLSEYQTAHRISDKCGEIVDSVRDMEGASMLLSAVAGVRQKSDDTISRQQQKISKEVSSGLDDADRRAFFALDHETQCALAPVVSGDDILREGLKMTVAKSQTVQQPPGQ